VLNATEARKTADERFMPKMASKGALGSNKHFQLVRSFGPPVPGLSPLLPVGHRLCDPRIRCRRLLARHDYMGSVLAGKGIRRACSSLSFLHICPRGRVALH
jgi:hypothetical protein